MPALRSWACRAGVLLLVLGGLSRISAADPKSHALFDAYPLSDSVASLCLHMVVDGRSRPVALVYFQGVPGWHNRKWQSKTNGSLVGGTEASYELTSSELVLSVRVSADAKIAHVQGKPFSLADSNVFLVKDADKEASVVPVALVDLSSISGKPLAVAAVRGSPIIAKALGFEK